MWILKHRIEVSIVLIDYSEISFKEIKLVQRGKLYAVQIIVI